MEAERAADNTVRVPFFGVRKFAKTIAAELAEHREENARLKAQLDRLSSMSKELVAEFKDARHGRDMAMAQIESLGLVNALELRKQEEDLNRQILAQRNTLSAERAAARADLDRMNEELKKAHAGIVATDDLTLLQEAGIYQYRHPLKDVAAYEYHLAGINEQIKAMIKKHGGAILATTTWTVNGSDAQGRAMVRDISKLMLRAFNAEADDLVRSLKPYKVDAAIDKLNKVAAVIERLGQSMHIKVSPEYLALRTRELLLTSDYLQKLAEQKELERAERERMKDERKALQEIERERERLDKERQHYFNARAALVAKGDHVAADRISEQLSEVERELESVDFRAANNRAGYVYVISNIGSFGDRMVKIGMTRRLDPMERLRELSDASVPFNFDVHALFFSADAVGIETALHQRLAQSRVNFVNQRREFFRVSPADARAALAELAGELLQFEEVAEALEYRQSAQQWAAA
jgi:hypothetical protein